MFQQSVVVNKPHFKPVVFKPSSELPSSDEDSVMPLEYFSGYELELQETILQLNSQLEDDSSSEEDEEDECFAEPISLGSLSCSDNCVEEVSKLPLESSSPDNVQHPPQHSISSTTDHDPVLPQAEVEVEFGDCEQLLQKAVHELSSLLVCS